MRKKYYLNKFFVFCLAFYVWSMAFSMAQADEVKYFHEGKCSMPMNVSDNNCLFGNEIQKDNITIETVYWEVHYKDGKITYANWLSNSRAFINGNDVHAGSDYVYLFDEHIINRTIKFDDSQRLIVSIVLDNGKDTYYEICKHGYASQTTETQCFDKKGNLKNTTIIIYKNNQLYELSSFDPFGNLTGHMILD